MDIEFLPPTAIEIKEQLERIITSPRFEVATQPSRFLVIAVQRKLRGKGTSGHEIKKAMFTTSRDAFEPSNARVTASNLRKLLKNYYENEGQEDSVIITLPPTSSDKTLKPPEGQAYTPTFRYNPRLDLIVQYRLGLQLLEGWTYREYENAAKCFSYILERQPDHLGGVLGMIEAVCKSVERDWSPGKFDPPSTCSELLNRLPPEAESFWKYWAVRAKMAQTLFNVDKDIDPAYVKALELDRSATEAYPDFIEYVIQKSTDRDYALGIAYRYFYNRIESTDAQIRYASFLMYAGMLDEALEIVSKTLTINPISIGAHFLAALGKFLFRRTEEVESHLLRLQDLCDSHSWQLIVHEFTRLEKRVELEGWTAKFLAEPSKVRGLLKPIE